MKFEDIQKEIWESSISFGIDPYTIYYSRLEDIFISKNLNQDYNHCIAFYIWEDYSLEEYYDYYLCSKEYHSIRNKTSKKEFLNTSIKKVQNPKNLESWKKSRVEMALNITCRYLKGKDVDFKVLRDNLWDHFKSQYSKRNCWLSEVVIF